MNSIEALNSYFTWIAIEKKKPGYNVSSFLLQGTQKTLESKQLMSEPASQMLSFSSPFRYHQRSKLGFSIEHLLIDQKECQARS